MLSFRTFLHAAPDDLCAFRYRIYVEEMHRKQRYADHLRKRIEDPLDRTGRQIVACHEDRIVGCVRINFLREGGVGDCFDFCDLGALSAGDLAATSICTRLMIDPEFRGTVRSRNCGLPPCL